MPRYQMFDNSLLYDTLVFFSLSEDMLLVFWRTFLEKAVWTRQMVSWAESQDFTSA